MILSKLSLYFFYNARLLLLNQIWNLLKYIVQTPFFTAMSLSMLVLDGL